MSQSNSEDFENARSGYQAAVNLWTVEGQTFWAKFNAMLVANSILLASIGFTASKGDVLPRLITVRLLPIIGMVSSIVWLCMIVRSYAFNKYWIYSARELEEYLHPVKTVLRGKTFSRGKKVRFRDIVKDKVELQIPLLGRPRVETASYILITAFILIYAIILVIPNGNTESQAKNIHDAKQYGKAAMLISGNDTHCAAVTDDWTITIAWLTIVLTTFTIYSLVQYGYFSLWRAKRRLK